MTKTTETWNCFGKNYTREQNLNVIFRMFACFSHTNSAFYNTLSLYKS